MSPLRLQIEDAAPRWAASRRAEADYAFSLWRGFMDFIRYCRRAGVSPALMDATAFLGTYAYAAARGMVTGVLNRNARGWREAARRSGRTDKLYNALRRELSPGSRVGERYRQLVEENARLIGSFPARVAEQVTAKAAALQQAGGRSAELLPELMTVGHARARVIARTEVSKASVALTQARSEDMALPWYVWRTSEDERVRRSHRVMEGVLCRWDDPPAPERLAGERPEGAYAAGGIYNCRCYPEPLVDFRQITWPHKIYLGGRVQRITLGAFRAMNQIQIGEQSYAPD